MIFSPSKWNDADEIRPYVAVSMALDFRTTGTALANALALYIRPLLGDALYTELQDIYAGVTDIAEIREDSPDIDMRFLYRAQRANALLGMWSGYDELQTFIGAAGAKRLDADHVHSLYRYQEESLKSGWKTRGFDALDDLLGFLEENIAFYPDYRTSPCYVQSKEAIVRSTAEVDTCYSINRSRLIFLRLKAHFRVVEDILIAPRLGTALYTAFKSEISRDVPDVRYAKLREKLVPVVVFYAVARLMRETGRLTDKGLFFTSLQGGGDSYESSEPVSDARLVLQADTAEAVAVQYWQKVERFLRETFGIEAPSGRKIPVRDNTGKKTFWT